MTGLKPVSCAEQRQFSDAGAVLVAFARLVDGHRPLFQGVRTLIGPGEVLVLVHQVEQPGVAGQVDGGTAAVGHDCPNDLGEVPRRSYGGGAATAKGQHDEA
jgi:hypothetical protein